MIPANFDYHPASTLSEAFSLFQKYGDEAKYMSGGHSLLPMMKLRFATPKHVIDISPIEGLSYVKEEKGMLKIGALTTETELEHNDLLKKKYPIFGDVSKLIADPAVRNFATVGGNIAHGDAANDQPSVMIAHRATLVAEGPKGKRTIEIDDFFKGFYTTALEPAEILVELQLPEAQPRASSAYHKIERKVGDYATAGAAVYLELDKKHVCQQAGIGLTNVSSVPMRAARAEDLLRGKEITPDIMEEAGDICAKDCSPASDLRGSESYKRAVTKEIVIRMIKKTLERIGV